MVQTNTTVLDEFQIREAKGAILRLGDILQIARTNWQIQDEDWKDTMRAVNVAMAIEQAQRRVDEIESLFAKL